MFNLLVSGWMSVSVSEFHTVEVQSGEEVALLCSNFSSFPTFWFKLANASHISSVFSSKFNASLCDGFPNSKFNMTNNTTDLFMSIKQVDFSDSGLYFCGCYTDGFSVISIIIFNNHILSAEAGRIFYLMSISYFMKKMM